jgi:hypothetical protein
MDAQDFQQEYVHLGPISEATRGIEPIGPIEEETGSRYLLFAGIREVD